MAKKTFELELKSWREIAPGVRHFCFEHAEGENLPYRAGQFFTLHLERDGEEVLRSYSVAAPCVDGPSVEFSVSFVEGGIGTGTLFAMEAGDKVRVSGPHGRFILRNEEVDHYVLVATGTGIAPFRSMIPQLLERVEGGVNVSLVLGVREPSDLLYGEEFQKLAAENEGFNFYACYSQSFPDTPSDHCRSGRVQCALGELSVTPGASVAYLCGNPQMVDDMVEALKDKGLEARRIRREKYVSA